MPRFKKYLRGNPYYDPERVDKIVTTLKNQSHPLSAEQNRWLQNVSPVVKNSASRSSQTTRNIVNGDTMSRQKVRSPLTAFEERDFADPKKRQLYRELRNATLASARGLGSHANRAKARAEIERAGGSPQKVSTPSGANKKYYDPTGKDYAVTTSGNIARTRARLLAAFWQRNMPGYRLAKKVIPCIQTKTRKQVMFAQKSAGKAYKVPHRHDPNREPC